MPQMPTVWIERCIKSARNWYIVWIDVRSDYDDRCKLGEGPTEAMAQRNALACAREIVDRVSRLEISRLTAEPGAVRDCPEEKP